MEIENEQCDGDRFDGGSLGELSPDNAICNIYGYIPMNGSSDITCNQECRLNFSNCEINVEPSYNLGSACIPDRNHCSEELICKNFIKGDLNGNFESHILPGGYCTTNDQGRCQANGIDRFFSEFNICLQGCTTTEECRAGYDCLSINNSPETFCIPNSI